MISCQSVYSLCVPPGLAAVFVPSIMNIADREPATIKAQGSDSGRCIPEAARDSRAFTFEDIVLGLPTG